MEKKTPQRMCLVCRQFFYKKDLIRVVKIEDRFELDETFKKNGRGAYICKDKSCIEKCIKTKGLNRSFKSAVDNKIYESLREKYLEN